MTQGFYEQLGVHPTADASELRDAYHRQVARLSTRTKQLRAQRGDTAQLDLARAQLDEAWAVLSVPSRRQRYDIMLALFERGVPQAESLWESVSDALIPPAVAAATRLLSACTELAIPAIGASEEVEPEPLFPEASTLPTLSPPTSHTVSPPTTPTELSKPLAPTQPVSASRPAPAITAPRPRPVVKLAEPNGGLKVVQGTSKGKSVIVLPPDTPRQKTLPPTEVGKLTDIHGYSGGLLRAVREAKGITLDQVAKSTRISVRYLQAIEEDAHDRLPSATFVKGYVREISRLLKLDEEAVVSGYMRRLQA